LERSLKKIFLLILISLKFTSIQPHALVFVHLGPVLPNHLEDALWQASLFNDANEIYVIAQQKALEMPNNLTKYAHVVKAESLNPTLRHNMFIQHSILNKSFRDGFWTLERFLYLDDFIQQYDLKDVFHLENDNTLYANLKELLPIFQKCYQGIGAVFDNDDRCIPGFLYIAHKEAIANLSSFFAAQAHSGSTDMEIIASYKKKYPDYIQALPIIPLTYGLVYPLVSNTGKRTNNPLVFSNNIDQFNSIFDAAAIGQYLGGIDPRNGPSLPGFINESCLFNPANFTYEWKIDKQGRMIPYTLFQGTAYRINNLHIHSKNLTPFLSKARESL
jgi:hypothetical protein